MNKPIFMVILLLFMVMCNAEIKVQDKLDLPFIQEYTSSYTIIDDCFNESKIIDQGVTTIDIKYEKVLISNGFVNNLEFENIQFIETNDGYEFTGDCVRHFIINDLLFLVDIHGWWFNEAPIANMIIIVRFIGYTDTQEDYNCMISNIYVPFIRLER